MVPLSLASCEMVVALDAIARFRSLRRDLRRPTPVLVQSDASMATLLTGPPNCRTENSAPKGRRGR